MQRGLAIAFFRNVLENWTTPCNICCKNVQYINYVFLEKSNVSRASDNLQVICHSAKIGRCVFCAREFLLGIPQGQSEIYFYK